MAGSTDAKSERKIKKIYWIMAFVVLLFISSLIIYYIKAVEAISVDDPKVVELEIPEGASSKRIANILKERGLIRNELIFQIVVRMNDMSANLKAGLYSMDTGMDIDDIIQVLSEGGKNKNVSKVTIPEGYEIRQIADELSEMGMIDREKFLELTSNKEYFEDDYPFLKQLDAGSGLEGYLFPSTYEFYADSTEDDIIRRMLDQFQQVYEENIEEYMDTVDLSLNEVMTLASIIEREAKRDDERELISSVFYNRLKQGMLLQSCATVQYALEERKEELSDKDTRIESEYNTYINKGLPPAPIASPGKGSMIAAIRPADGDYLYFRTKEDGTGAHVFSRTYSEHLEANPNK
ncbi:MAG: endolytic transglycosylase MltG [Tissierellia bacterium]|nr:endolytic transglycosylase MltG [Tissierellia bacterium]